MKKYLFFAGQDYYPKGGWEDFICDSDSIEELHEKGKALESKSHPLYPGALKYGWYQIIDCSNKKVVFSTYEFEIT